MGYFTTRQDFFVMSSTMVVEEREKLDRFLNFLEASGVAEVLTGDVKISRESGGRPAYNRYDLFATILYGFAFTSGTLRDLESACHYDLRFIYLMNQETPSHVVFGNYINSVIVPNLDRIFSCLIKRIFHECGVTYEDAYIDGTKIEADANKYKFVWKPTKYHEDLCEKIRQLLSEYNLSRGIPAKGIFSSKIIADKLTNLIEYAKNTPDDISVTKAIQNLKEYLNKSLEYEEKEEICGPNRNSYYKSDHDATAMTLKTDYYSGLASNMHAAYNAQIIVIKGFVCAYYVSQSRTDITEFVPVLDKFHELHGTYPENVCADAGYGSLENYRYLEVHKINNYVKHQSWEGNVSGLRPNRYRLHEDCTITCLNGKNGSRCEAPYKPHHENVTFYKVTGCKKCEFRLYCKQYQKRKSDNYKYFEVNEELVRYRQTAEENLLSPKGIEIRVNRSCQVEGSYGVLKQDMRFIRFRRISLQKVTAEFALTFIGYNLRKLFRFYNGKLNMKYWVAPKGLEAEQFKKPSPKKTTNHVKKRQKSNNQKAKSSYNYKHKKG